MKHQKQQETYKEVTDPKFVAKHSDAMAKARLAQQEKAIADALESKKRREEQERERKKDLSAQKSQGEKGAGGTRSGGSNGTKNGTSTTKRRRNLNSYGYNAMDPASNSSSGSRYR